MSHLVFAVRGATLLFLMGVAFLLYLPELYATASEESFLSVSFLDVGQGDAVYVTTPDGYELLIDGGSSAMVLRELAAKRSFFDKKIDMVIATHPDTDHIGGLVDVLNRYEVDWIVETAAESDSPAAVAFQEKARTEDARLVTAQAGQTFQLGSSTTVHILSPHGDTTHWETNTASVVVQIVYGDIEFMLTGDAPQSIEDYLAGAYGASLESEVLKLGHHGSRTSSSETFLNVVHPEYAVVSAAADNRYGHPHQEVLERASKAGAQIIDTAQNGTVTFQSDGKEVWIEG